MGEVRESEILSCYGKRRIENRVDQCPRRTECPWGDACLSLSNEHMAAKHYHIANVSVGFMHYDPNRGNLDGSAPRSDAEQREALAEKELMNTTAAQSDGEPEDVTLETVTIPGERYEIVCSALERIADLYFNTPVSFETLMKSIFQKKNQSDVSRERGVTRQGLNKRLLYELGIAQKRNDIQQRRDRELAEAKQEYSEKLTALRERDAFFKTLTPRQWAVYVKVFDDGCSIGSAAAQLKLHKTQVARCVRFLRSKLNKTCTNQCRSKQKN